MKFEIVCCLELKGDAQVYNHLMPLARHPLVERIWIVRSHKCCTGEIPNCEWVLTPSPFRLWRWLKMLLHCFRLARRRQVRAFVSFNPIPYGLISNFAARFFGKPVHYGFIGTDWYRDALGCWGICLRRILRKGDFFTATGSDMHADMIANGFSESRISVLPHSIDLENYPVSDPSRARYACIFAGRLIQRKRVDIIIRAFKKVLQKHPGEKLCIAGDGPLMAEHRQLVHDLGIESSVDFVGYVKNVQPLMAAAKIILIASFREGFPFSLVEGICSGLVPVSTPVGTIPDLIQNGENGLLFAQDDEDALAGSIISLIDSPEYYSRLREKVLSMRSQFSYGHATMVWDKWLSSLAERSNYAQLKNTTRETHGFIRQS